MILAAPPTRNTRAPLAEESSLHSTASTAFDHLISTRGKSSSCSNVRPHRVHDKTSHPSSINARVAVEPSEIAAAGLLVDERYAWRGYAKPSPHLAYKEPQHHRITLIAVDQTQTVGTLTLGLDSDRGLQADHTYGQEICAFRSAGRRLCEFTGLAIARRADSRQVLVALFREAYVLSSTRHRVTDVLIEVNPRHVAFYRQVFNFSIAAGERQCSRVNAPSVLLHLESHHLTQKLAALLNVERARKASTFAYAA